jgi:hypothetical protein
MTSFAFPFAKPRKPQMSAPWVRFVKMGWMLDGTRVGGVNQCVETAVVETQGARFAKDTRRVTFHVGDAISTNPELESS